MKILLFHTLSKSLKLTFYRLLNPFDKSKPSVKIILFFKVRPIYFTHKKIIAFYSAFSLCQTVIKRAIIFHLCNNVNEIFTESCLVKIQKS